MTKNDEKVGEAIALLSEGLAPFVAQECKSRYGENWIADVGGDAASAKTDAYFLLKTVWDEWHTVFRNVLGETERTYVKELRDVRNRWAHQETFTAEDVYRALDTAQRLLQAIAAGEQVAQIANLKKDVLKIKVAEEAKEAKASAAQLDGMGVAGLKAWREIVTPHPDVASGRYVQAEFAADLAQVYRGEGSEEYRNPVEFYRRTFLTEGLTQLLVQATQRLAGTGGTPIVDLQTNFGGGKTHSLLALYHLCSGAPLAELE
ncbi:MAG: Swt1 family HEPN domain-containing protein, partial [bacterium]